MIDVRVQGRPRHAQGAQPDAARTYYNRVTGSRSHDAEETRGDSRIRIRQVTTVSPRTSYQLRAFVDAIRNGTPVLTPPSDAVKNMDVIDAIYVAAGMLPRQPTQ